MKKFYFILVVLCLAFEVNAQDKEKKNFRIVSYNVENYFDALDDSLTVDEEYLPTGIRAWNISKYQTKQNNIAKVIAAIGGWDAPALVALCEIESEKCMRDLTRYSPLKNLGYNYLHHESPDARGVDVALMYQPEQFKPFHDEAIRINFTDTLYKTRDILFVSGILPNEDTLHVFVCHFPSRLGGELESEDRREFVASALRTKVDSLFNASPEPNIVIMGDFNDYPTNSSIMETLKARPLTEDIHNKGLYNLAFALQEKGKGSHKFEGEWGMLDQIIVSGSMLNAHSKIFTTQDDMHVFDAPFLLEEDAAFLGKKPFRTYVGMKYQGGFADHLPVFVDLWY